MNYHIFRQYDVRGVAGRDLTPEVIYGLGRAFGTYLMNKKIGDVVMGRDNRLSSRRLRDDLTCGLLDAGCRVVDIGLVVTPVLYYAGIHFEHRGGVMITGSHNPPEENGFKLVCGESTIYGEDIQELKKMMENRNYISGRGHLEKRSANAPYLDMLKQKICLGPRRLKVAVDCGSGAAGIYAERILKSWGCEVIALYCEPDGNFPFHHPDPVKADNLRDLRAAVKETGADLGVAYDGDADRLGVVDEKGGVVWGDKLMILFWRDILPKYPGARAIIEVKCSESLVEEIIRLGGNPFFYKTGHSLIKAKMREIDAVFTGEMSGHMFFADEYYGFDDAFYATGRLLRILSHASLSLSELLEDIPRYYSTAEIRIPCADSDKFTVVEEIKRRFSQTNRVITVDGVKVYFDKGWGLIRASNTQPALVARCEAATPRELKKITSIFDSMLSGFSDTIGDFEWDC